MAVVSFKQFVLVYFCLVNWTHSVPIENGTGGTFHDDDEDANMYGQNEAGSEDKMEEKGVMETIFSVNKEAGYHFKEGDIVVRPGEGEVDQRTDKRELVRDVWNLWRSRIVPYEIAPSYPEDVKKMIVDALDDISSKSCVKFVPLTNQKRWVKYVDGGGCFSAVGRSHLPGPQEITIGFSCRSKGVIQHETLHALGFQHEQSRPDRDKYVEIFWENIASGGERDFKKYELKDRTSLGSSYDYNSIMHYDRYAWSKNGRPTILAIGDPKKPIGKSQEISTEDILQLDRLYKCKGAPSTSWSEWSPCNQWTCQKKRQRWCSRSDGQSCGEGFNSWGFQDEIGQCTIEECYKPLDGHWNKWSSWSSCSKTCEQGTKRRTRVCDDPKPRNGGRECEGKDWQVTECTVFPYPCSLAKDGCLFEKGMCHWKDVSEGKYNWRRQRGKTGNSGTGPDGAHSGISAQGGECPAFEMGDGTGGSEVKISNSLTGQFCIDACKERKNIDPSINGATVRRNGKGGCWCERNMKSVLKSPRYLRLYKTCAITQEAANEGYFMYTESSGIRPGQKATLESKQFPAATKGRTLIFYYNMYGVDIGLLKVILQPLNGVQRVLWKKSGNQGEVWNEASVPFTSDVEYKIIFEATKLSVNPWGDIAIDTILFIDPAT